MMPNLFAAATAVSLMALSAQASESQLQAQFYAGRNGEAEAQADLAAGKPLKLYAHVLNGRAPGFRAPGLLNCDPGLVGGTEGQRLFAPLPKADWQEGEKYPAEYYREAEAANRFASRYNQTIFKARKAQILRLCPRGRLEK